MQKFTIFTIILSTIIVTVIAELVVQDYLQRVYPNSANLQANTLAAGNSFEDFVTPIEKSQLDQRAEVAELVNELEQISGEELDANNSDNPLLQKIEDFRNSASDDEDTGDNSDAESENQPYVALSKVETLLPALQIPGITLLPANYPERLFQLIDTSSIAFTSNSFATLNNASNEVIGSVYEFKSRTEVDAENAFNDIRILANSFPNITTNQTNQFGDRSMYINHSVKVGEVFVVAQKDDRIYAFAYKKEFHEQFKVYLNVLL